jgi:tetratricopeptide (TPR) repeat protein
MLLVLLLMPGCKGDDAHPAAPRGAPKGLDPLGAPTAADSGTDRIRTLTARLNEDPRNVELLGALADAYFEARRYPEAIPIYEQALAIAPGDADLLNDLGLSLFYLGKGAEALAAVTAATEADPAFKHAWLSTGFILLSMGRLDEAVAPLNKVKELDPNGPLAETADGFLEAVEAARAEPPREPAAR